MCRDEKWTDRKREDVRKIEAEWEGAERWGVVLAQWSLSASECQQWKLVIWCDHTYLCCPQTTNWDRHAVCLGFIYSKQFKFFSSLNEALYQRQYHTWGLILEQWWNEGQWINPLWNRPNHKSKRLLWVSIFVVTVLLLSKIAWQLPNHVISLCHKSFFRASIDALVWWINRTDQALIRQMRARSSCAV